MSCHKEPLIRESELALSGKCPQHSESNKARKQTEGNVVNGDENEEADKSQTHMKISELSSSVQ